MSTPRPDSSNSTAVELELLHKEVAAFNAEMRSATPAGPLKAAWVPFSLGAVLALAIFMVVSLMPRLA